MVQQFLYNQKLFWMIIEPQHDKTNKMSVCLAKTRISLGIRPVWSESSLCTPWVAKNPSFLYADSEDSNQTGRMPRLIWVFAGCTAILFVLSCRSLYVLNGSVLESTIFTLWISCITVEFVFKRLSSEGLLWTHESSPLFTNILHHSFAPISVFPQMWWGGGGIPWGLDSQNKPCPQEFERALGQGWDLRCLS